MTDAELERSLLAFAAGVEEVGPTVRDFQSALDLSSTSVATYRLMKLERAGLIEHIGRRGYGSDNRPYRLTAKGRALAAENALEAAS